MKANNMSGRQIIGGNVPAAEVSTCRRGCCWTPYGHSALVPSCPCHDEQMDEAA